MERCASLSDQLADLTQNFLQSKETLLEAVESINELKSRLKKLAQDDSAKFEFIEQLLLELDLLQKKLNDKVSSLNQINKMVIFIQDELDKVKRSMHRGENVI